MRRKFALCPNCRIIIAWFSDFFEIVRYCIARLVVVQAGFKLFLGFYVFYRL